MRSMRKSTDRENQPLSKTIILRQKVNLTLNNPDVLLMLIVATLGILSWRYLGIFLYKKIEPDSTIAKFVNAIAYGMTTAIVFKMIFFPNSTMKLVPFVERTVPFFLGIIVFLIFPKNPNLALIAGIGSFALTIIYQNYL